VPDIKKKSGWNKRGDFTLHFGNFPKIRIKNIKSASTLVRNEDYLPSPGAISFQIFVSQSIIHEKIYPGGICLRHPPVCDRRSENETIPDVETDNSLEHKGF